MTFGATPVVAAGRGSTTAVASSIDRGVRRLEPPIDAPPARALDEVCVPFARDERSFRRRLGGRRGGWIEVDGPRRVEDSVAKRVRGEEIGIDRERGRDLLERLLAFASVGARLSGAQSHLKSLPTLPRIHERRRCKMSSDAW